MNTQLEKYLQMLEQFLSGVMPAGEFTTTYLNRFKSEREMDEPLYEVLEEVFAAADSFTTDPELLAKQSSFYIDEARLRAEVQQAVAHLSKMKLP